MAWGMPDHLANLEVPHTRLDSLPPRPASMSAVALAKLPFLPPLPRIWLWNVLILLYCCLKFFTWPFMNLKAVTMSARQASLVLEACLLQPVLCLLLPLLPFPFVTFPLVFLLLPAFLFLWALALFFSLLLLFALCFLEPSLPFLFFILLLFLPPSFWRFLTTFFLRFLFLSGPAASASLAARPICPWPIWRELSSLTWSADATS